MVLQSLKYCIVMVWICCVCVGCGYRFNAFDPQLQQPNPGYEDVEAGVDVSLPELAAEAVSGEVEVEIVIPGCTDADALNYNSAATVDDGSCMKNVFVTFNLDTSCTASAAAPQVAGGETFGMPGDNPMSDPDGDGVWSVTIELPPMLSSSYTYTSAVCDDWSCKENIAGQDCAVPPYSDRSLNSGTEDHDVNACFGNCGDGSCGQCPVGAPEPGGEESCGENLIKVDFYVDMTGAWEVAQNNVIALQGSFDNFYPGIVMARIFGTKLFGVAICLEKNTDYTFKYASYEYTNGANEFPDGQYATDATPCPGETETFACQYGTCTERLLSTGSSDMALDVLPWGGCDGYRFEA